MRLKTANAIAMTICIGIASVLSGIAGGMMAAFEGSPAAVVMIAMLFGLPFFLFAQPVFYWIRNYFWLRS